MLDDPRQIIAHGPMGRFQVGAVGLCLLLFALDGFDVLAVSFAAPGITAAWGIDRAALGIVLSMELVGMSIGSLGLGRFADRVGRRPTILVCLAIMVIGMFAASTAENVYSLSAYRVFTGIGIGGMLASTSALVAEYSNLKRRSVAVALMAAGYPVGAVVGGTITSVLLASYDWQAVFLFGGIVTALFFPFVLLFLPESVDHLIRRRPVGALATVNRTLIRMGHRAVEALPDPPAKTVRLGTRALFAPDLASTTLLLTAAYFTHIMTFYFILKWVPKIVVDMGFPAAQAGGVLVWANVGGMVGAFLLSLLAMRLPVRALVLVALVLSSAMVTVFGVGQDTLVGLSIVVGVTGFCTNSAVVGMFALIARSFPPRVRGGGTGFVLGMGRGGAALGPVVAGFMFEQGQPLLSVAMIMAGGSLIAAVAVLLLKRGEAVSD